MNSTDKKCSCLMYETGLETFYISKSEELCTSIRPLGRVWGERGQASVAINVKDAGLWVQHNSKRKDAGRLHDNHHPTRGEKALSYEDGVKKKDGGAEREAQRQRKRALRMIWGDRELRGRLRKRRLSVRKEKERIEKDQRKVNRPLGGNPYGETVSAESRKGSPSISLLTSSQRSKTRLERGGSAMKRKWGRRLAGQVHNGEGAHRELGSRKTGGWGGRRTV